MSRVSLPDELRSALPLAVAPAFQAFQNAIRDRHSDAVFERGLSGGPDLILASQQMRWQGLSEDLVFGVSVTAGSIHASLVGKVSGRVHLEVPPLPLADGAPPDRVCGLAGLLAFSFGQLALLYLEP